MRIMIERKINKIGTKTALYSIYMNAEYVVFSLVYEPKRATTTTTTKCCV